MFPYRSVKSASASKAHEYDEGLRSYMMQVYSYMTFALILTGLIAFGVANSKVVLSAVFGTPLHFLVMFAPIGVVLYLSLRINTLSFKQAQSWFWFYSALMGVSLASIFIVYTGLSVARVFFVTAGTFGAMSIYGYTTKRDLTAFGSFLIMGMIGIFFASIVNIFIQSSAMYFIVSVLGVIIFTGLTAYDTQRIKAVYYSVSGDKEALGKAAILGALNLYIDFINLMIMLLNLMGERR